MVVGTRLLANDHARAWSMAAGMPFGTLLGPGVIRGKLTGCRMDGDAGRSGTALLSKACALCASG